MENQKYVIVDLETTGHSPKEGDRMIQIAMVIMKNWEVEKTFTTFIHPGRTIPLFIQDLTNISDQDVKDALPFESYAEEIYEILQDAVFVAHNADFDLSFCNRNLNVRDCRDGKGRKLTLLNYLKYCFLWH